MNDNLDNIFIKYGTDKSSLFHNYSLPYSMFFDKIREKKLNILEIGVSDGCSINSWAEFFPNSTIVGIDRDIRCKEQEKERIFVEIGDQTDKLFLERVSDKYNRFNIIIDDGGHIWNQQKTSFEILFKKLLPDGFYVVEDLSTSYQKGSEWDSGDEPTFEFFKKIFDDLNLNGKSICGIKEIGGKPLNYYESWIEYIFLFKGFILIKKRIASIECL